MYSSVDSGYDPIPPDRHVVTVGNFDGVHRGHQYLLAAARERASSFQAKSAVVTFDPFPLEVLAPERAPSRLTTTEERVALLRMFGIDDVVVLEFNEQLSRQSPRDFVVDLVRSLNPCHFVVGDDFAFGHRRSGTVETLRDLGDEFGFSVEVVERVGDSTLDFSSTRVRTLLLEGDVAGAAEVLGRPYNLSGEVVSGDQRGRDLGFPTANLAIPIRRAVPADGIYAAKALLDDSDELLPAMAYVGTRPTFGGSTTSVEVNLLEFDGQIYGHRLSVLFVDRIRDDRRFSSVDELMRQMERDRVRAIEILGCLPEGWPGVLGTALLRA